MTELEHAIKHIKTRADAWAVKEVTEALQSISERLDKALKQEPTDYQQGYIDGVNQMVKEMKAEQEPCRVKNELNVELNELKPCTDAVSREAVLNGLRGCICDEWVKTLFATMVKQLPSVTQKSGKWIIDLQTATEDYYICSECGRKIHLLYPDIISNYPYCHCGAKMESEDKE